MTDTGLYRAFIAMKMLTRVDVAVLRVRTGVTMSRCWMPVTDHLLFELRQMPPTWTSRMLA